MSNKRLGLILVAIVIVGLAGFGIWQATKPKPSNTQTSTTAPTTQTTDSSNSGKGNNENNQQQTTTKTSFTSDEVKQHNKKDDCWTIIDGAVYNLTSYVSQHPGGDDILKACGEDGSTMFNSRQDEDGEAIGSGTPHSNNAKQQLERLKIGTLSS